jgi:hypothetical protein
MAKKVIDIFPPRDRAVNSKAAMPQNEEEAITPDIRIFSQTLPEEPAVISRIESAPEAAPESEPEPKIEPKLEPPMRPRVTFMGNRESFSIEDDAGSSGSKIRGWLVKLFLAASLIAAVMFAIDWKVARAVVKVWPATSILSEQTQVTVDPAAQSVDQEKGVVPGLVLTVEDAITGSTEVTGKKDTQGKATGTVKIFNNYTSQQRLVKNTRLQAPLEKFNPALTSDETPWFRTLEDVVLEPKTSTTVTVIADGAGDKYNIDPSIFSVPGLVGTAQYTFVYAQSFEKFQGGSMGSAPSVVQADLDNAKTAIDELAKSEMEKKLLAQVPQGYILIDETKKMEFGDADIQAKAGDSLGKITAQVSGKVTAVAYKKADLDNLGKNFILGKVPQGSVAYQNDLQVGSSYQGLDPVSGNTILSLTAQVPVYPGLEDSALKKGLSEKSADEARLFLEDQGMRVQIMFTPPWRTSIPRELDRIEVQTIIE